ncbi:unnamed protein product [Amoebophrya sp. A25]|nr:unnamed protein product [Amoebophrya sp. A25]|eukprot:GSA25T00007791001.1
MLIEKAADLVPAAAAGSEAAAEARRSVILSILLEYLRSEGEQRLGQLHLFFTKSEARDKSARLVQYFCKFLSGMVQLQFERRADYFEDSRNAAKKTRLNLFHRKVKDVQISMSDARRTHRWAKEFVVLAKVKAIRAAARHDTIEHFNLISKLILAWWLACDHYAWLCKVRLFDREYKPVMQYNMRFNVAANAFQTVYQALLVVRHSRRIWTLSQKLKELQQKRLKLEDGSPVPDAIDDNEEDKPSRMLGDRKSSLSTSSAVKKPKSSPSTTNAPTGTTEPSAGAAHASPSIQQTSNPLSSILNEQRSVASGAVGSTPTAGSKGPAPLTAAALRLHDSYLQQGSSGSLPVPPESNLGGPESAAPSLVSEMDGGVNNLPTVTPTGRSLGGGMIAPLTISTSFASMRGRDNYRTRVRRRYTAGPTEAAEAMTRALSGDVGADADNISARCKSASAASTDNVMRTLAANRSRSSMPSPSHSVASLLSAYKTAGRDRFSRRSSEARTRANNRAERVEVEDVDVLISSTPALNTLVARTALDRTEEDEVIKQLAFHRWKRREALALTAKGILQIVQALHNGSIYEIHDAPIGVLGIISSMIDIRNLWPAKQAI